MTKPSKPTALGDLLAGVLAQAGITDRVAQASVVPEWASLVGERIAAVTEPLSVGGDGTLWVAVASHAWMTELSLLEPELLRALNAAKDRPPVLRIRLTHRRPEPRGDGGAEGDGRGRNLRPNPL